ncbi:MAG: phosphoribosylamine--glycine ligase [Thermoplasmatales archaeon]|nr:MAG: phosphoribosylamine--glycine ligase [Thermoplasmatales archaeon]
MNVLVVGGGAREHAICDTVSRSKNINLYSVMNNLNPGIERMATDYLSEKETNIDRVVEYAKKKNIDLVLIGPEAPLELGLADELTKNGISTCAPTKDAARVETDKEWMRNLVEKHQIPGQLKYESFSDVEKAKEFINGLNCEVAIKPVGLTGGKGVRISGDHFNGIDEAMSYVKDVINNKIGGAAKVLIEEKAVGEEFTLQAFSDSSNIVTLPAVQDHKRLLPGDRGPNTGGMGSYSCANGLLPFLSQNDYNKGVSILQKIVDALNKEGCKYVGPIYGQFILTSDGIKIIEINARFGDPENMNVLPLLKTDFIDLCNCMLDETLSDKIIKMQEKSTVCKYVVPEGYGVKSMIGERIQVGEEFVNNTGAKLFYASVNKKNNDIFTTSSRSLAVVGIADKLSDAEEICEKALTHVKGDHIFIRHDIGTKNLIEKRVNHMNELRGK